MKRRLKVFVSLDEISLKSFKIPLDSPLKRREDKRNRAFIKYKPSCARRKAIGDKGKEPLKAEEQD